MHLLRAGCAFEAEPLPGGVSCDVWLITKHDGGKLVLKRPLPKLRVAADWHAPEERARTEAAWLRLVGGIDSSLVPKVLGEHPERNFLAIEYLSPERYSVWKGLLAAGSADAAFAERVGSALARIHGRTAADPLVQRSFAKQAQFLALRLEPYLLYTAEQHADVADTIRALAGGVAEARTALMQGDISPKNILCGPSGPVFLDAETACYGDPAFDLAFCLNHLMLKCIWRPQHAKGYLACFRAMAGTYLTGVTWEACLALEQRAAALLPALLLARIDGKSPVEYLTGEADKTFVRAFAIRALRQRMLRLAHLSAAWENALYSR